MKIRAGFVSNSSSSSFVIAVATGADAKADVVIKVDLSKYADYKVHTVQELDAAIIGQYGWKQATVEDVLEDYGDSMRKSYEKMKVAVGNGKVVMIGRVSNDGDPYEGLLYDEGIPATHGVEVIMDRR